MDISFEDEWAAVMEVDRAKQAERRRQKAAEKAASKRTVQLRPRGAFLMYRDSQGDLSERSIEVRAVTGFADKKDPGLIHFEYMEAYCFTKRAKRNFRLDRIKRLTDSETGEVVEAKNGHSIRAWLCDLLIGGEIA